MKESTSPEKLERTERLWHNIAGASKSTLGNVLTISRSYVTATSPDSGIIITARHATGANPALAAAGLAGVPQ